MTQFDPPCVRRVDLKLTYESFDHSETADEHDNGQIWSATLWDVRRAVKRDIADRIILESHFQLDGFTTFARGARAIIDADRNLYRGRNAEALRRVFHRRGIGPVE
jgi:predicted metal-dependent phosphotriesterase family hydrolase